MRYLGGPNDLQGDVEMLLVVLGVWLVVMAQGPLMIMGALKMRHLESYGLALAGSIAALVPVSPLAVFGLPVGVWALSVLMSPEVKAAFPQRNATLAAESRATEL
jgi:hypothetical protein